MLRSWRLSCRILGVKLPEPKNILVTEPFEDLRRRYRNSAFLINMPKNYPEPFIGYITDFELESDSEDLAARMVRVYYRNCYNGDEHRSQLRNMDIQEVYPERGLYNYVSEGNRFKVVLMIQRSSKRQWMHGISNATMFIETIGGGFLDNLYGWNYKGLKIQDYLIRDLFKPWFPETWKDVLSHLENNPCVAFNREFGVMANHCGPDYILYKHNKAIGFMSKDKKVFILHERSLAQELTDLITRKKLETKVQMA